MDDYIVPMIPRPLNEPLKMSNFSVTEITIFLCCMLGLWVLGSLIIGVIAGVTGVRLSRYLSNTKFGNLTTKGVYWFFPHSKRKYKFLIPSHIREILG